MKLFVWDLHGTLEQGNENAAIEMSNLILEKYGYAQRFSDNHSSQLYGLKWYQYFEFLLPEESAEKHVELQAACFAFSNSPEGVTIIARHIQPSRNAIETLQAIAQDHEQVLISNTTPESLPVYINALGLHDYFNEQNAIAVNQHAREAKRTKYDALTDFVQGKDYDEIIVIGDSATDMELARQTGGKAYLYAHAGQPFRSKLGDYKIDDLKELLREV
ncbi:MAG TPA: HAD family hydrolase [Candidatus Saccharimonadales bacterium]|nr:HAD family hydrolase [Candidatus Saccharimonadales bacterium]